MALDTQTGDNEGYEQYLKGEGGSNVSLAQLQDLADEQVRAEAKVARLLAELDTAQKELKKLCEEKIPTIMDEIGVAEFKTRTGLTISVEETIRASIPKPRQAEAFGWLRANNHGALIKRTVSVEFGKGEDEKATELRQKLGQEGFSVEDESKVHAQTLGAWVREKLAKGVEIPLEMFGVFRQRVSKIKS